MGRGQGSVPPAACSVFMREMNTRRIRSRSQRIVFARGWGVCVCVSPPCCCFAPPTSVPVPSPCADRRIVPGNVALCKRGAGGRAGRGSGGLGALRRRLQRRGDKSRPRYMPPDQAGERSAWFCAAFGVRSRGKWVTGRGREGGNSCWLLNVCQVPSEENCACLYLAPSPFSNCGCGVAISGLFSSAAVQGCLLGGVLPRGWGWGGVFGEGAGSVGAGVHGLLCAAGALGRGRGAARSRAALPGAASRGGGVAPRSYVGQYYVRGGARAQHSQGAPGTLISFHFTPDARLSRGGEPSIAAGPQLLYSLASFLELRSLQDSF